MKAFLISVPDEFFKDKIRLRLHVFSNEEAKSFESTLQKFKFDGEVINSFEFDDFLTMISSQFNSVFK